MAARSSCRPASWPPERAAIAAAGYTSLVQTPFSRTLRSLEADRGLGLPVLGAALVLLLLWSLWFVGGRVTMYESTRSARLEVDATARALVAELDGEVVAVDAAQDDALAQGDPIFEIDTEPLQIQEDEAVARRLSLSEQSGSAVAALAAEEAALESARIASANAVNQAEALARQAEAAARQAEAEAARAAQLLGSSSISPEEAERLASAASQAHDLATAYRSSAKKAAADANKDVNDRTVRVEALRRELSSIDAETAGADASLAELDRRMNRAVVRAPIDGRIIELAALKVGDRVTAGAHLGSVLPDGTLRAIAHFPPHVALGRIEVGQLAALRLDAFPWAEYGTLPARVLSVAGEARYGQIRVELEILADPATSPIPLQHGLVGSAEVAVEQISPFELVLRTVGKRIDGL